MGVISIVNGDYNPTNMTGGAPPCIHKTNNMMLTLSERSESVGEKGHVKNIHIFTMEIAMGLIFDVLRQT